MASLGLGLLSIEAGLRLSLGRFKSNGSGMSVGVITNAGSDAVFLCRVGHNINRDFPEALIRAESGIISHRIRTG